LVDAGWVTEVNPLDAARTLLICLRLEALLLEQPGAFEMCSTEVQTVTPEMWWDKEHKVVRNPDTLAWVARFWPDQPLSGTIGAYYEVSLAACSIAHRPDERVRWERVEARARANSSAARNGTAAATAQVMEVTARSFDDRKHREAAQLVQVGAAKLRAAARLLADCAEMRLPVVSAPLAEAAREAFCLAGRAGSLAASLRETSFGGRAVPQSVGEWRNWETVVGEHLLELGVAKSRVVKLFERLSADPEDERTRISRNLRRLNNGSGVSRSARKAKPKLIRR
jgi:hypothetical protein